MNRVHHPLFWAVLLFAADCHGQAFTFWNETGQNISSIGYYRSSGGFTSLDWGSPGIANGAGPITVMSGAACGLNGTPVCSVASGTAVSYVNGAGPWPYSTSYCGSNNAFYVVFCMSGTTPSTPEVYNPPNYTNSGCVTLQNNTGTPQYYQFQATGGSGTSNYSGCGQGITANGAQGSSAYGDGNEWMAVYPGESIQVCATIVDGTNSASRTFCAMQAPAGLVPCGLQGLAGTDQPRCVDLCDDGVEISGNGSYTTCDVMAQSASPNNTTGTGHAPALPGDVANQPSGTNGIIWPAGTSNCGLMLDITGRTGFAAINNDLDAVGTIIANGVTSMNNQNLLDTMGIEQAIHSNAANVVISNLVVSNLFGSNGLGNVGVTNFPTNYPDAAAIGWLSQIATNTARTNGFDTNLEASAVAITSNTAAALAYTNLNLSAYSTNPSDIVTYASNTLAGPINDSLQGYAQSASTAAQAVTVGGSPGDLLTISFDLPVVGGYNIDCNPMDNTDVADFASWFRGLMEWVVGLSFIGMVLRDGMKATQSVFLSPQGQFPKLLVLGNSVGWPLAAVYIVALISAMVAVPFVIVTWFSVGSTGQMWWQQVAVNPFSGDGVGRAVSLSLWLADQFQPMSYIVSSALYYISFRFALGGIVTAAATIVRALMA
jgi:hypothetical protein